MKKEPFEEILKTLIWEELKKEGIDKESVNLVMLDIAFTPVTPFEGCEPVEVIETQGGNYIVKDPTGWRTVTPEVLKVMRYRYLQNDPRRIEQRVKIHHHFGKTPSLSKEDIIRGMKGYD